MRSISLTTICELAIDVTIEKVIKQTARRIHFCLRDKVKRQIDEMLIAGLFRNSFAEIAAPLHQATEKCKNFEWNDDCQKSFDELRQYLTATDDVNRGLLVLPDFKKEFRLEADASDTCAVAVLSQKVRGILRPVAYWSKRFTRAQRKQGHESGNADALSRWLFEEEESETDTYPDPGFVINKVILREEEFNDNQLEDEAIAALYQSYVEDSEMVPNETYDENKLVKDFDVTVADKAEPIEQIKIGFQREPCIKDQSIDIN
ncbi:unnamed protein product [Brachionus calyciflorus]|uniref:Reverse transcriptase/retrotransposon-derived protein RNase H-like domain-containing protein n=1 Tax=Brachionus calyciflorus TaxID=104777 RepID=A0A814E1A4_9BILA|nr:unnamed protein product [Brachionus calyciflorus]